MKDCLNTVLGHFEYSHSFRIHQRPRSLQALVNDILRDFLNQFMFVCLDDILIVSCCLDDHITHVCEVLQRLLENRLCKSRDV